jgi:hypothetical protein
MPMLAPWLQIDPLAGVNAYATGLGRGSELRRLDLAEQEAATRQAESARHAQLREEQLGAELAQNISQARERARLRAMEAAGQAEFRTLIDAGVPPDQALLQAGPKLFASRPQALIPSLAAVRSTLPFVPSMKTVDGQKLLETSRGRFNLLKPEITGPVQTQPLLHPITKQPIPDQWALPTSTGGYHTGKTASASATAKPTAAFIKQLDADIVAETNPETRANLQAQRDMAAEIVRKSVFPDFQPLVPQVTTPPDPRWDFTKMLGLRRAPSPVTNFVPRNAIAPTLPGAPVPAGTALTNVPQILAPPAALSTSNRVRVREKSTGRLGWWEGGEVPSEYEVIQPEGR